MPKDPAFLFYPGDWMTGTMILNRHQKGCYIDLLVAQFNNGPLSFETIQTVLGQDQASWTVLSRKFKKDSHGNFWNERLAAEIEKRKNFYNSKLENGKKGGRPPNKKNLTETYRLSIAKPINNLPENENENENKDFEKSEKLLWTEAKKSFLTDEQWEYNFLSDKKISRENFKKILKEFIKLIEDGEDLKSVRELRKHFTNWFNKKNKAGEFNLSNANGLPANLPTLNK